MPERKKLDYILLIPTFSLLTLGLLIIFSISASISQEKFGNTYYFALHQILFGILPGILLGFVCFKINLNFLKKKSLLLFLLNLILLAVIFLPEIGTVSGGARRWLNLGFISFQPSEFLKITFFLYLCSWLGKGRGFQKMKMTTNNQYLIFFLIILLPVSVFLILQPDISTLAIILFSALLIYFLAGTPFWHTIILISLGGIILLLLIMTASYRTDRFLVFINPQIDPTGTGYQLKQSLISIGSGGIFGKGFGMSKQKLGFLPFPMSDAPFAVFAEEAGLVGSSVLLLLFLLFALRGFIISNGARDGFLKLLAMSFSLQIILAVLINIGALSGILPFTGTPLPFISYGGTHLTAELMQVGMMLNISKNV